MTKRTITDSFAPYSSLGYLVINDDWGAGNQINGVNYTNSITFDTDDFPNGVIFSWSWPTYDYGRVQAYPHITYTALMPSGALPKVGDLANLSANYALSIAGNTADFSVAWDIFLTDGSGNKVDEVMVWVHSPANAVAANQPYKYTDSTIVNAGVYITQGAWTYIAIQTAHDQLSGTVHLSDVLKTLIWDGVITGNEYLESVQVGAEVQAGVGSLTVQNLNYNFTPNATLYGVADNETFYLGAVTGITVVGQGSSDVVDVSGVYAAYQIKYSGSEVLLTSGSNISSLNILEGVGFIQFDDGIYNIATQTFTPGANPDAVNINLAQNDDTLNIAECGTTANVAGAGNVVQLSGSDDSLVVADTNGAVSVTGSNDSLSMSGTGNNISVTGLNDTVSIAGGGVNFLTLGAAAVQVSVSGGGANSVTLGGGAGTVAFSGGVNVVNATVNTLLAADSLTGSGDDTLALSGGGAIKLGAPSVFTGFSKVTEDNFNTALTLRNGASQSVILGGGADSVTGGTTAGSAANVTLGTGLDTVAFTTGSNSVNATTTTLLARDRLRGAGADTLNLMGGNVFNLAALAQFTGFSTVVLDASGSTVNVNAGLTLNGTAGGNNVIALGGGPDTVNLGAGDDTVTLGTGLDVVNLGAGSNIVKLTSAPRGGDSLTGSGQDTLELLGALNVNLNSFSKITGFSAVALESSGETLTLKSGQNAAVQTYAEAPGDTETVNLSAHPGSDQVIFSGSGTNIVNAVLGSSATIGSADYLAGAGSDILALSGNGGSLDLSRMANFSGFSVLNIAGSSDALVLGNANMTIMRASGSADSFNLGTGADTIAYTNVNESTYHGYDVISNFNATRDRIDLSGLGAANSANNLTTVNFFSTAPSTISAHSVDVVTNNGTTNVYANVGGSVVPLANNSSLLQLSLPGATGLSASNFVLRRNVQAQPAVSAIVDSPAKGAFKAGQTINLTLSFNQAVTVTGGAPTLTLNDGGVATFASGSGTNTLTFNYIVAPGQNTASLAAAAINLNGARISNSVDAANLSLTGLTQSGPQIDTTPPAAPTILTDVVTGNVVTLSGAAEAGSVVAVFDGTNALGGATAASDGTWVFATPSLSAGPHIFSANATDAAGNVSALSAPLDPIIGAPEAISLAATPASGDLGANKTVTFTLVMSQVVTVFSGTPTLTLNDGGVATYVSGSGTSALSFVYTVVAGQNTSSLSAAVVNLNGASILGGSGAEASVSLTGLSQSGPQIDTTPPTVTIAAGNSVVSNPTQTIFGAVDAADAGLAVTLFDGTTQLATVVSDATTGAWLATATLANGANSLTAYVSDAAGNSAVSAAVNFECAPLSIAAYLANPSAADQEMGGIYILDAAANVSAALNALAEDSHIASITLSDNSPLTMTVEQALDDSALISKFASAPAIVVADAAAALNALTPAEISAFADEGVTSLDATDQVVPFSMVQRQALGAAHIQLQETAASSVGELLTFNSAGKITSIAYSGVTGAAYTSYTLYFDANRRKLHATFSNGVVDTWSYQPDGSHTVTATGITGQQYTSYTLTYSPTNKLLDKSFDNGLNIAYTYNSDGSYIINTSELLEQAYTSYSILHAHNGAPISGSFSNGMMRNWSYNSDGSYELTSQNIPGTTYSSAECLYNSAGSRFAVVESMNDGSQSAILLGNGLTTEVSAAGLRISNGSDVFNLPPSTNQTLFATQSISDTFNFSSGFGHDVIQGMGLSGANHDVIQFSASMFDFLSPALSPTAEAQALLSHARQIGANVNISDNASDTLIVANATLAALKANPGDFRFV